MKRLAAIGIIGMILIFLVQVPAGVAGNGYMGGRGTIVVEDPPVADEGDSATDEGGLPDTVEGPLNDRMADAGKLFGDLYKILRYEGGETKQVPEVDDNGEPVFNVDGQQELVESDDVAIGGEPVLTEKYSKYALEVAEGEYEIADAPYPSQCVQPVADYAKWGNINSVTGLDFNRLPLLMTYDATWNRTECEVGELIGNATIDPSTGAFTTPDCSDTVNDDCINRYFEPPSESCPEGILWVDLVDEVRFGRLNLSRSPEAVLQAAFDEAIAAINDAISISLDASGRLLLEKELYSDSEVDECGDPLLIDTVFKAIDSPLENMALYVKLMKDGHLVTPGDERAPIDRSERGGIPLWKMLELSDGPSNALRPTIDIEKLEDWGLGTLVDVFPQAYYTYYECYTEGGAPTPCLCEGENHDGTDTVVACEDVASRELLAVDSCPEPTVIPGTYPNSDSCDEVPWIGIKTDDSVDYHGENTTGDDFDFAAAFLAAAADKTGDIGVDMIVYLNSIMGINKVVGYSAYIEGEPDPDAVNYSEEPVYFNFKDNGPYNRSVTFGESGNRGENGNVTILLNAGVASWEEKSLPILNRLVPFDYLGIDDNGFPNETLADSDVRGFTQMADDNLAVIKFIHTYQIPGLR